MHHCVQLTSRGIVSRFAILGITIVAVGLGAPAVKGGGINGFNNGTNWTGNSNNTGGPTFSPTTLTLTDGNLNEARSAFYDTAQPIGNFTAVYTYQATQPGGVGLADGATFILQTQGLTALGDLGSALGVGGTHTAITPSAELEINILTTNNYLVGTNFATNGSTGSYNSTGNVNVASGDPIQVSLSYNGTVLSETLTDTKSSATFSTSYTTNLSAVLGSNTAYVGFTGATGEGSSLQVISDFVFTAVVPEPPSLVLLGAAGAALGAFQFGRRYLACRMRAV